jgi:hypothetical protein
VRLFDPRRDTWSEHFTFLNHYLFIVGITPVGVATQRALGFNAGEIGEHARLARAPAAGPMAPHVVTSWRPQKAHSLATDWAYAIRPYGLRIGPLRATDWAYCICPYRLLNYAASVISACATACRCTQPMRLSAMP